MLRNTVRFKNKLNLKSNMCMFVCAGVGGGGGGGGARAPASGGGEGWWWWCRTKEIPETRFKIA